MIRFLLKNTYEICKPCNDVLCRHMHRSDTGLAWLDNSARMNVPGTADINWSWRLKEGQVTDELGKEICSITKLYGRANWDALNSLK